MKTISFIFVVASFPLLMAQPSIDPYQFFRMGDEGVYFGLQTMGLDPGPAGDGVVWDFSQVERNPTEDYGIRYLEPSQAPFTDEFPGTDLILCFGRSDCFRYYYLQRRGNRVFHLGRSSNSEITNRFTDVSYYPDMQMTFGQTKTSPIRGQSWQIPIIGPARVSRIFGETSISYDGYGMLILPDGRMFDQVIRLKTIRSWVDGTSAGSESGNLKFEETRYQYFEPGHSAYLFEMVTKIVTREFNGRFQRLSSETIASYRAESNSKPLLTAKRGTHLTRTESAFQSGVLIQNPTAETRTVALTGVDAKGDALTTTQLELLPEATTRLNPAELWGPDAASFYTAGCNECALSLDYRAAAQSGASAQVHQVKDYRSEFFFYPGEWEQVSDGQAIVNVSDHPTKITATQTDFQGNVLKTVTLEAELPPGGKHLSLLNEAFVQEPDSIIRLESDGLMNVMALRISNDSRFLYQNESLPASADGSLGRWLPHFTRENSGFNTDIIINNQGEEAAQILFQSYDGSGNALAQKFMLVPAKQILRFSKKELFSSEASHASFMSASNCLVSLVYRADSPEASSAVVHESSPQGTAFRIYPGDRSKLFDGVSLINTGDSPATIQMQQIAHSGEILTERELVADLAPNAKFLSLLEDVVPDNPATILRIESTQPLAVLSLRLSKDNRYLFRNAPLQE